MDYGPRSFKHMFSIIVVHSPYPTVHQNSRVIVYDFDPVNSQCIENLTRNDDRIRRKQQIVISAYFTLKLMLHENKGGGLELILALELVISSSQLKSSRAKGSSRLYL